MPRMTDAQFAEGDKLVRQLHAYLDKYGDDGDEFTDVWGAVNQYVRDQDKRQAGDNDRGSE